ncbi:MAG: AEC family transporter [Paracoccaceae bacterium]|jgi:malonate transporter
MLAIFLKTLPFFAIIGLGYGAARTRFVSAQAAASLTQFVFYFALSAMLFRFAAQLPLAELFDWRFVAAYLLGSTTVYCLTLGLSRLRGTSLAEAAIEAQCGVIGNTGFLGMPMLVVLLGPLAAGPVLMVLAIDLIVFSTLITIIITASREGRMTRAGYGRLLFGLIKNPMIVSMSLGLCWSLSELTMPTPMADFLTLLGGASTPGALFAIGASLAVKSAENLVVTGWVSFTKLLLHPAAVAISAFWIFHVDPRSAAVMVSVAALPVAGNVYILAQYFGLAPERVSAYILVSTVASIVTVSLVIAWALPMMGQ